MDRKLKTEFRVTSYDVGPERTLKPSAILRIIQEAAGRHMEQDGLSYEFMRSRGVVFLLVKECVKVHSYPYCDDVITVETWFHKNKGATFVRNMRFASKTDQILIEAETHWIIADPETHRILRPSQFPFIMPEVGEDSVSISAMRLATLKEAAEAGVREVRWSDIDCNYHMNNAVYADIICDYFPGGFKGRKLMEFQIDFNSEAMLGDKIRIYAKQENSTYYFEGMVNGKKCFGAYAK